MLFTIAFFAMSSVGAPAPALSDRKLDAHSLLKEMESQQAFLMTAFRNEEYWKKPEKKKELVGFLETAKSLRSARFAPILVDKIDFQRYPLDGFEPDRLQPLEEQYPILDVLQQIGIEAVPSILTRMKELDPENRLDEEDLPYKLLVDCIANIYERGGYGKLLARRRIELEADKSNAKDKKRLLAALTFPALVPDKDKK